MAQICEHMSIPHVLEMNKAYPRDWLIKGRLRVLLKTPEGNHTHEDVHSKKDLMLKMGELIPKLKNRVAGGGPPGQQQVAAGPASAPEKKSKEAKAAEKKLLKKANKKMK